MKKLKIYVFILFSLTVFSAGCLDDISGPSLPEGNYKYTAYDSLGNAVAQGLIIIEMGDSIKVTGIWKIKAIGNVQNIGPQTGEGNLNGELRDKTLMIGLNPNYVDNNVTLNGTVKENWYSGKWYYSSFVGVTNWGTFRAIKE